MCVICVCLSSRQTISSPGEKMETNNHRCVRTVVRTFAMQLIILRERTKKSRGNKLDRLNDSFVVGLERDRTRDRKKRSKRSFEHTQTTQNVKRAQRDVVVRVTDQFFFCNPYKTKKETKKRRASQHLERHSEHRTSTWYLNHRTSTVCSGRLCGQ